VRAEDDGGLQRASLCGRERGQGRGMARGDRGRGAAGAGCRGAVPGEGDDVTGSPRGGRGAPRRVGIRERGADRGGCRPGEGRRVGRVERGHVEPLDSRGRRVGADRRGPHREHCRVAQRRRGVGEHRPASAGARRAIVGDEEQGVLRGNGAGELREPRPEQAFGRAPRRRRTHAAGEAAEGGQGLGGGAERPGSLQQGGHERTAGGERIAVAVGTACCDDGHRAAAGHRGQLVEQPRRADAGRPLDAEPAAAPGACGAQAFGEHGDERTPADER
jgi:hypothetical protein